MSDSLTAEQPPSAVIRTTTERHLHDLPTPTMRIRNLLLIFIVFTLSVAVAITVMATKLYDDLLEVEEAQERRFTSYLLAEELRRSSDELTRFVRTYAATGDERFQRYFHQVLDIRNGIIPRPEGYEGVYWDLVITGVLPEPTAEGGEISSLEERMMKAGLSLEEFSKLKQAQVRSDELVRLEDVAMHAVKGQFDDGTGSFSITREPDRQLAIDLVNGERYHAAKAAIMQPIGEFLTLVDRRTQGELERHTDHAQEFLLVILGTSALMLLGTAAMIFALRQRLMRPGMALIGTVERIASGDLAARTGISGRDEVAVLAAAIDTMAERLSAALDEARRRTEEAEQQAQAVIEQRAHSERLLNNILPALISDRLKKGEKTIAETFPEVTVLFADIVGFTNLSAHLGPRQIVSLLNDIFGRFDELASEYRLEKIKTIGDCYMVVGGVPDRSPTHCQQVAEFALAALASFQEYARDFSQPLRIRIGIHTGTVVAGIVGKQKFAYDLWGDVVNVASRLESTGQPDHIHVSDNVRVRLADDYDFEERGEVELKGKGKLRTFFLVGRKPGAGFDAASLTAATA